MECVLNSLLFPVLVLISLPFNLLFSTLEGSLEPMVAHFLEKESLHCLRMHQNSQKSWEFVFLSIYNDHHNMLAVACTKDAYMNLDFRNMPEIVYIVCWSWFGLRMLVVVNLAIYAIHSSEELRGSV